MKILHNARRFHLIAALLFLALFVSTAACQTTLIPELLYYRFNEGAGTTTANLAVPGIPGTASITPVSWNLMSPLVGPSSLDASVITLGVVPCRTNTPLNYTGSWTIEVTGMRTGHAAASGENPIIYNELSASVYNRISLINMSSIIYYHVSPGVYHFLYFQNACPMGVTFHLSIVFDAATSTLRGYVNGVLWDSMVTGITIPLLAGPTGFQIGGQPALPVQPNFPGIIDEFRVWSRVRIPPELANQGLLEIPAAVGNLKRIFLDPSAPSINFNTGTQTFNWTGSVVRVEDADGLLFDSPAVDSIIGASVEISGVYSGMDTARLSDVSLSPVLVRFNALPAPDEINFGSFCVPAAEFSRFRGSLNLRNDDFTVIQQDGVALTQRAGSGSSFLDRIAVTLNDPTPAHYVAALSSGGPKFREIVFSLEPIDEGPDLRFISNGLGSLEVGAINAQPGGRIYNFVALNPTYILGSGPFFGMEFGPLQLEVINSPFPNPPLTPFADTLGNFFFSVSTSLAPPGLVIEHVGVVLSPSGNEIDFISPPTRIHL